MDKHSLSVSEEPESSFENQYQRLITVTRCCNPDELAELLDVPVATVIDARRLKDVPADWLLTLLQKKSINPQWILTGRGRMVLPSEKGRLKPVSLWSIKDSSLFQCSTEDLIAELVRRALLHMS